MPASPRLSLACLSFTPAEWEIIKDRLAVPDCIAEALAEDYEEGAVLHAAADLLASGPTLLLSSDLQREIIDDCVDGSTVLASLEKGSPEYRVTLQHCRNIEHKIAYHFGTAAHFPRS